MKKALRIVGITIGVVIAVVVGLFAITLIVSIATSDNRQEPQIVTPVVDPPRGTTSMPDLRLPDVVEPTQMDIVVDNNYNQPFIDPNGDLKGHWWNPPFRHNNTEYLELGQTHNINDEVEITIKDVAFSDKITSDGKTVVPDVGDIFVIATVHFKNISDVNQNFNTLWISDNNNVLYTGHKLFSPKKDALYEIYPPYYGYHKNGGLQPGDIPANQGIGTPPGVEHEWKVVFHHILDNVDYVNLIYPDSTGSITERSTYKRYWTIWSAPKTSVLEVSAPVLDLVYGERETTFTQEKCDTIQFLEVLNDLLRYFQGTQYYRTTESLAINEYRKVGYTIGSDNFLEDYRTCRYSDGFITDESFDVLLESWKMSIINLVDY